MKKVKTFTFDPAITRPVTLRHVADEDLIFKSETENFNFGLQLKSYNVLENLKDRKSNYNSAYFLSDLQSLSSILELDTPYEFVNDSRFTTYIKLSSNYIKAENSSSSLSFDSNFNYLDSKYFFTVTLSTNRYLYITKQFGDDTYYAYCSSESIYLSSTVPGLSSHLFEYVLENNNLKLYPYKDLANPLSSYQVIMSDTLQLTSTDAGNTVSSVFDVNRNTEEIILQLVDQDLPPGINQPGNGANDFELLYEKFLRYTVEYDKLFGRISSKVKTSIVSEPQKILSVLDIRDFKISLLFK